jgi:hypothetical protein
MQILFARSPFVPHVSEDKSSLSCTSRSADKSSRQELFSVSRFCSVSIVVVIQRAVAAYCEFVRVLP